jgi:hypothetical protein
MTMLWFLPASALIGWAGTHAALRSRHTLRSRRRERMWWLLIALAWLPAACWILSQIVRQEP